VFSYNTDGRVRREEGGGRERERGREKREKRREEEVNFLCFLHRQTKCLHGKVFVPPVASMYVTIECVLLQENVFSYNTDGTAMFLYLQWPRCM